MRFRLFIFAAIGLVQVAVASAAGPAVELELLTERGVQITAPREWLQLLAGIGIDNVRIRSGQPGDRPEITGNGAAQHGSFHVVGVINSHGDLLLPGGAFTRADRAKLRDYFARLSTGGADAVTAPHVRFGFTEKELTALLADLAQPVTFETKGLTTRAFIDRLQPLLAFKMSLDADADEALRAAPACVDQLQRVSAGTALAIMLHNDGLAMRPEKTLGQPTVYHIVAIPAGSIRQSTLGKMTGAEMQYWPIGWEPNKSPAELVPSLFVSLNAQIDGFTLEEALAAIGPRVKLPILLDREVLKLQHIDPAKLQVKLAPTRTSYKRVIDRVASQAHLGTQVRIDEAGAPFLWITQ